MNPNLPQPQKTPPPPPPSGCFSLPPIEFSGECQVSPPRSLDLDLDFTDFPRLIFPHVRTLLRTSDGSRLVLRVSLPRETWKSLRVGGWLPWDPDLGVDPSTGLLGTTQFQGDTIHCYVSEESDMTAEITPPPQSTEPFKLPEGG